MNFTIEEIKLNYYIYGIELYCPLGYVSILNIGNTIHPLLNNNRCIEFFIFAGKDATYINIDW